MSNKKDKLSIFISLILRHKPEVIGIKVDRYGYVNVSELIDKINEHGKYHIDFEKLEKIVISDSKRRYSFKDNKTKIRANQGHSFDVDLGLLPVEPPEYLYHGTANIFVDSIMQEGIKKRSRNHVHLSQTIETAIDVGTRHGKPIILIIKSKEMYNDGYDFYISENNVWLSDFIPKEYIIKDFSN